MDKTDKKPAYLAAEETVRRFWEESDTFAQSVQKDAENGDYAFYDGPPFATGTPHYGHIVGQIMKDVVPRFWTMKGYSVERRWGWDCHGLPIENLVEKELGITNKQQIVEMGVEKFNELCRTKVLSYVDAWRDMKDRLGRWVDMDNDYKTMDLPFMESVWWVFKQLWDKGLVYEGYRSMYICPRCETTLSQAEVSEGYKDIKDLSVVAKFELLDEPKTYLLAWTTTPWTLPGNVALAVNPDLDYIKVKRDDEFLILSKNEHEKRSADVEVVATMKGTDLVGKAYKPLFDYYASNIALENHANGWKVYAGDFVLADEGTGIVHIAPAFGEDDMNLGKEQNLPFVQHVSMDGTFKPEVKDFAGLHVKPIEDVTATDVAIIKYLAANGLLFAKEKYEHSYPHCWRCDTPLINYATSSWFVSITKIKEDILEAAKTINWSPDYIKDGRFGNWLDGARDWSISRQRFWASVMPLWRCDACDHIEAFGSAAELKAASGHEVTDLHKDVVDKITYACSKCQKGTMKRVPDVLDTWFDSGSMPYGQMHYPFEREEHFEKIFPAAYIAEGIDQTRTWFYYLHVIASALFKKAAFKNVAVNGTVLAEDGKKMSKKLNNYPDPMAIFDTYGADALRAYLLASPVVAAENLNFTEKGVEESLRKNIMLLWNVYAFYEMYQARTTEDLEKLNENAEGEQGSGNVLDQWIVARLNQLTASVNKAMEAYDLPRAMRPITEFIDDFSTWYLRRSRDRFKEGPRLRGDDKTAALATMKHVFTELSKVMAPFMPFTAEALWQKVTGHNFTDRHQSVHLEHWPYGDDADEEALAQMQIVRRIVEMGLAARDAAKIKIRQPLAKVSVAKLSVNQQLADIIKDELNVKAIEFIDGIEESAELDTTLTPELEREGLKREIVRLINNMRKEQGMTIADRIAISWSSDDDMVKQTMESFGTDIKADTLANELINEKTEQSKQSSVNGKEISLSINKI